MGKVYCENCKYYEFWPGDYGVSHICNHLNNRIEKHNSIRKYYVSEDADERNEKNDCKDFEQKVSWWRRLKSGLLGRKDDRS